VLSPSAPNQRTLIAPVYTRFQYPPGKTHVPGALQFAFVVQVVLALFAHRPGGTRIVPLFEVAVPTIHRNNPPPPSFSVGRFLMITALV
ncbi:MAG: hypothetical protein ACJ749_10560, partial [Flavisolibacter sp.]